MIQTQQNTFVLFTLFKLTLDERKTLTKISTCKTSHNYSKKGVCITGGESEALGFHQETTEESRKHQELVLYKILHYFVPDYLHFLLYGSRKRN